MLVNEADLDTVLAPVVKYMLDTEPGAAFNHFVDRAVARPIDGERVSFLLVQRAVVRG